MRSLTIAGISFRIRVEGLFPLSPVQNCYREFVDLPVAAGDRTIDVTLRPKAERLNLTRVRSIVRGAESWDLFSEADDLIFAMPGAPGTRDTLWTCRCDRALTRVVIGTDLRLPDAGGGLMLTNCFQYPLDQLLVMYALGSEGFVVHAGGAVRCGCGLIYGGVSGAGKTTLSRLIEPRTDWSVLSDDRIVVRRDPSGLTIQGTPWPGEGGQARNVSAPLRALVFLEKGRENSLLPLAPGSALRRLLPLVSIPWYDRARLSSPLDLCGSLVERVPAFTLTFTPDPGAADTLEVLCDRIAAG